MATEGQHPVPISRQTFLRGVAGVAVAAGIGGPRILRSRARKANPARPDGVLYARVTADLSHPTGKTVPAQLYGYATGDLIDGDFLLAANGVAETSAETLAPPLIRFNTSQSSIIQTVFAKGVSQPDWTHVSRWVVYHADFLANGKRLIFGIGPNNGNTSLTPATWAAYAKAMALHFRAIGQEITYWEVGNENDIMGAAVYSQYFNAVADALHSVNHAYLVGGPVASYYNGIDLRTFVELSGTRLGFIDFHSYTVLDTDTTQTAFARAYSFYDIINARNAIAGTVAAKLPIALLEYNMNGSRQPNGTYGLAVQGTITGAVYIALLLTRAFDSDPRFTMGGLWDLLTDSYYGAIGNAAQSLSYQHIDEQGWYLREAARILPGQQASTTTTGSDLQALATASDLRFSLQLVNFSLDQEQSVATTVIGREPGSMVERWELSARYPAGYISTTTSLAQVPLPPQSIVILNGLRT
jgi:hypothetical protein